MDTGWIKLYRKILINDGLFRSAHTFTIWCWLLLRADKKTGEVTVGRHMLSEWLKIKPSTVYLTLQRLENMTMVKLKPNNKMTTVVILNWHTYQDKPDNKIRETKQQDNTIQEYKKTISKKQEEELPQKVPNRLNLSRGQLMTFAKEFQGLTTTEIKEQQLKCNAYMNMSSQNYTNPGLFFKGWLKKYQADKNVVISKERLQDRVLSNLPDISEEERQRNLKRLADMKKTLKIGGIN